MAAGEDLRKTWDEFFSAAPAGESAPRPVLSEGADLKVSAVRARREAELLRYPNVAGVSDGIRIRQGKPTGERCLVVYVNQKIPTTRLAPSEILPGEIDGVGVDVVEVGKVEALLR
ncbi:MAG: hypothetical protein ACRD96_18310 [Bryobacteraceae bacterium]